MQVFKERGLRKFVLHKEMHVCNMKKVKKETQLFSQWIYFQMLRSNLGVISYIFDFMNHYPLRTN